MIQPENLDSRNRLRLFISKNHRIATMEPTSGLYALSIHVASRTVGTVRTRTLVPVVPVLNRAAATWVCSLLGAFHRGVGRNYMATRVDVDISNTHLAIWALLVISFGGPSSVPN